MVISTDPHNHRYCSYLLSQTWARLNVVLQVSQFPWNTLLPDWELCWILRHCCRSFYSWLIACGCKGHVFWCWVCCWSFKACRFYLNIHSLGYISHVMRTATRYGRANLVVCYWIYSINVVRNSPVASPPIDTQSQWKYYTLTKWMPQMAMCIIARGF